MSPKIYSYPELTKKLPKEVRVLFKVFKDEIRLVGGCVRDLLLEKKVNDFDFATKFLPAEIIKILTKNKIKAVPTGIKFGTITAVVNGKNFEITTLRKDDETNGRHCKPQFVDDYFLDAMRRDFTINALYLDSAGLVYDYFAGISDLKNKKVKFIGDAKKRIEEDFLRILRFFRFSFEYAKSIDNKGLLACVEQKENLKKLSRERIRAEILKMLLSDKKTNLIAVLKILKSKKIIAEIFCQKLEITALERLFQIEENFKISASLNLKIAVLFLHKNFSLKNFSQEISATNLEKKYWQFLFLNQEKKPELAELKQLLAFEKKELVLDFYLFGLAKKFNTEKISEAKKNINFLKKFVLPKFPLVGQDLMQLGFKEKEVGIAIDLAKKNWAKSNFKNDKKTLLQNLKSLTIDF